jgi:hypothetical protein
MDDNRIFGRLKVRFAFSDNRQVTHREPMRTENDSGQPRSSATHEVCRLPG